ncbi:arabinosyltransferase domain-containing protein [Pseudonocardia sp. T1-2H]|uniref:arabinosyltransferase domain-containing protein n=1 Tax=Pseudonocardia sp. T1-2H TaxID=3128899 RepID=UPI0031014272
MLTPETVDADRRSDTGPAPGAPPTRRGRRRVAAGLGILAALLAIATPFLPVQQNTAELSWPTAENGTAPVTAPLVALRPERLDATVPCAAITSLDARSPGPATVFTTTPPGSPDGAAVALTVRVTDGTLTVDDRGERVAEVAVGPAGCTLGVASDVDRTTVEVGGTPAVILDGDRRPQVIGVYSDLDSRLDPVSGTSVRITTDNRYDSSSSGLKVAAGVVAVLALIGSLLALRRIDDADGRRLPRTGRLPAVLRGHDTLRDAAVVAVLALWVVIGGMTSDDGYILGITRGAESSGYIGNYYRWFDVPEAPFGWFYQLYSLWSGISDSIAWLRIPAFAMGVASWFMISRGLLPRLGTHVRHSRAAGWAAAGVFLCFWLPYDNGLRPEPVVVIAALLSLVAMERALATRRLMPIALALISGAFAVAATPTGLIALAPFLASARPLLRLFGQRARTAGWLAVLAPLAGAGLIVLVAIFGDQSWAAVSEATRVRTEIGPNLAWYEELYRYELLFTASRDGSLMRRFPVLLLILCLVVSAVVILRRGRIPGAGLGASRRLIGSTLLAFVVLALTPTKWTHHFGAFAALGAGLAALAAVATSTGVLRSRRNQALFLAAVLAVTALAFTGPNTWWYVSNWGVPWFDKPVSVNGVSATSLLLLAAVVSLGIAAFEHLHGPTIPRPMPATPSGSRAASVRLNSGPIAVVCGLLVLFEVFSLVKGVQKQSGSYSMPADVVADPAGHGCGLAGHVLVETDPQAGVLPAAGGTAVVDGFGPNGLPPNGPGSLRDSDGEGNRDPGVAGTGPMGGPVLGSWTVGGGGTGDLRTGWYRLPDAARRGDAPLVLGVAGQVGGGNELTLEFSRDSDDTVVDSISPSAASGAVTTTADPKGNGAAGSGWRDVRLDLAGTPAASADRVRVVAHDRALGPEGWIAVAQPRVPVLTPLTDVVRGEAGYLDWPTSFASPCLRPFAIHRGVAEVPGYRIMADTQQREVGDNWGFPSTGGPLAWIDQTARERVVPTYLQGQWDWDWGQLRLMEPYVPGAGSPDVTRGTRTMWGWANPGPAGPAPPNPPTDRE